MFDFPNAPVLNQQVLEPNGAVLRWDGVKWVNAAGQVSSVTPTYNNVGRNLLHNPLFNIAQRGVGPFTTVSYTLDRWRLDVNLDSPTVTQSALTDTLRTQIGDEAGGVCMVAATVGNAGAASYSLVSQFIEDVRRLAGKTVTVSFWGWASSGTPKVGVGLRQSFGTGGSPSGAVDINATPITLSTTPTRYSVTATLASIAGKTLGTSNDSYTRLAFFLSSGANTNTLAGSIGVQTNNFVFWGMQLEIGSVATPLEKPDPTDDLQHCQRFYQTGTIRFIAYTTAGLVVAYYQTLPQTMRAGPTFTPTYTNQTNCTGNSTSWDANGCFISAIATVTGATTLAGTFTVTADL